MNKIFAFIVLLFTLGSNGLAQERTIKGTVKDNDTKQALAGVVVTVDGKSNKAATDQQGNYIIQAENSDFITFNYVGYAEQKIKVGHKKEINILLRPKEMLLDEVVIVGSSQNNKTVSMNRAQVLQGKVAGVHVGYERRIMPRPYQDSNTESYDRFEENGFISPKKEALSTFAVDVDAASYSNVRRMINSGQLPPKDAVRVEEMINYFQYNLQGPQNSDPVKIYTELSTSPWNKEHQLMRIALKAKDIPKENLKASNLVFLIDVSGSMMAANKLPLVQSSLKLLVDQLRAEDKVAIVTYAGNASVHLESTKGDQKMKIKTAIDELTAGGSTAGGAGIKKAYQIARHNFIKAGNNRIILATDGDFNVGESSDEAMEDLIAKERESGVNLTVLGYGMGNIKDKKMEILADKGRGNYAYIDNISEARKAMVTEFGGTLFTVAKDVKIQVEFNPAYVQAYRLVGYENRLMDAEDFNNDAKIGGDMGVGHTVTAIYEVIPVGVKSSIIGTVDKLKYQETDKPNLGSKNGELATVKFRYKDPQSEKSQLQQTVVKNNVHALDAVSEDFRFATAVAEFGMLLRNSSYKQNSSFENLIARAKAAKGKDDEGYRAEFIRMAEDSKSILDSNK
ncbi:vWA domain-containing protein [Sphingobacterium endophyticum]|uniref:vWA domain-containing protein n=1 Tax=Sphingobacterium endophyticum TaxID=2546448 RepID=UPI0012E1A921|nr:VWA domain-containing protein [Sphingobacterium endophyticum]